MKQKDQESKFEIGQMFGIAITFVIVTIAIAYGLNVNNDLKENFCVSTVNYTGYYDGGECRTCTQFTTIGNTTWLYNSSNDACYNSTSVSVTRPYIPFQSAAYNASVNGSVGLQKFTSKLPLIATVVIAAIIIGILVTYLYRRYQN